MENIIVCIFVSFAILIIQTFFGWVFTESAKDGHLFALPMAFVLLLLSLLQATIWLFVGGEFW